MESVARIAPSGWGNEAQEGPKMSDTYCHLCHQLAAGGHQVRRSELARCDAFWSGFEKEAGASYGGLPVSIPDIVRETRAEYAASDAVVPLCSNCIRECKLTVAR